MQNNTHNPFLGVLADNRSAQEQQFDIHHEEIFGAVSPMYLSDRISATKYVGQFPLENQYYTSSCVAHSKALVTAIFKVLGQNIPFVPLAPAFPYRLRSNYPAEGMIIADADSIFNNYGIPPYSLLPTPLSESEMNAVVITEDMKIAAKQNQTGKWIKITDCTNIDNIAYITNILNLPVSILIFATIAEWDMAYPTIKNSNLTLDQAEVRHCVTVLPNSAYKDAQGKRHFIIQDSASFGGINFRDVSEDFFSVRCYGAEYLLNLANSGAAPKPTYTFMRDLSVGDSGADVTALQQILQYLGYMPDTLNSQPFSPTAFYGGMTKTGVAALQNANAAEILKPLGLSQGSGIFGEATRAFINNKFSA